MEIELIYKFGRANAHSISILAIVSWESLTYSFAAEREKWKVCEIFEQMAVEKESNLERSSCEWVATEKDVKFDKRQLQILLGRGVSWGHTSELFVLFDYLCPDAVV